MSRDPFLIQVDEVPTEAAHGGSGSRKLLLSPALPISKFLQAMTKGYLPAGAVFDWHDHLDIDEFFLVVRGSGYIEYRNGEKMRYRPDSLIYIPANTEHRIENDGGEENEFFFVRVNASSFPDGESG